MQLYSWGWGHFGRLGHGKSSDVFNPQPVEALQRIKIKQIACGDSHCLAVTVTGQVQSNNQNMDRETMKPNSLQAASGSTTPSRFGTSSGCSSGIGSAWLMSG